MSMTMSFSTWLRCYGIDEPRLNAEQISKLRRYHAAECDTASPTCGQHLLEKTDAGVTFTGLTLPVVTDPYAHALACAKAGIEPHPGSPGYAVWQASNEFRRRAFGEG